MTPVSATDPFARLERALRTEFPGGVVELERFPSGAVWVDLRRGGRLFSLNYSPSSGHYEVFEVTEEHVLDTGPCEVFDNLDAAAERLRELAASPATRS